MFVIKSNDSTQLIILWLNRSSFNNTVDLLMLFMLWYPIYRYIFDCKGDIEVVVW